MTKNQIKKMAIEARKKMGLDTTEAELTSVLEAVEAERKKNIGPFTRTKIYLAISEHAQTRGRIL
jgi:hypothetical protein